VSQLPSRSPSQAKPRKPPRQQLKSTTWQTNGGLTATPSARCPSTPAPAPRRPSAWFRDRWYSPHGIPSTHGRPLRQDSKQPRSRRFESSTCWSRTLQEHRKDRIRCQLSSWTRMTKPSSLTSCPMSGSHGTIWASRWYISQSAGQERIPSLPAMSTRPHPAGAASRCPRLVCTHVGNLKSVLSSRISSSSSQGKNQSLLTSTSP
jgi:hypothetical protein